MADESVLKLPMDYQQSVAFRRLASWFGDKPDVVKANHVYTTVWTELAYLAKEGRALGRITTEERPIIQKVLEAVTDRVEELYKTLSDIRWFNFDGDDLVCPQFIALNSHLGPGKHLSRESKGGFMKGFNRQVKRAENPSFKQMILISTDKLVDGEGRRLDGEMVDRMKRTVMVCDSALGKKTRPAAMYSADLIAHAVAVCRELNDAEIRDVCAYLVKNRDHPALEGMVTEKLLPRFKGIIEEMNGVE